MKYYSAIKKKKEMATPSSILAWKIPWMELPVRLLCPWDSPGKNTGVGCHSLLQGIFLTQGYNPVLRHCRQILYHLSYQENPKVIILRCFYMTLGTNLQLNLLLSPAHQLCVSTCWKPGFIKQHASPREVKDLGPCLCVKTQ